MVKKRKPKKVKCAKQPQEDRFRNEHERRLETLNVIYQLRENNMSSSYPAIRILLEKMSEYVREGSDIFLNIPFPEMKKRIKGKLAVHKSEEVIVMLKCETFD